MPFQPVGNGAEVVIKGQNQGEECVTTFGALGIVNWTGTMLENFVADVATAWQTYILPILPTSYTAFEVVGTGLRTASDFTFTYSYGGGAAGTRTGNPMPNNVSLAIARKSNLAGRSNRGRIFWPGFCENDVLGNAIVGTFASTILSALGNFTTDAETSGNFALGVITRYSNNVLRNPAVVIITPTWAIVDATVDSQRRRLPNRGT